MSDCGLQQYGRYSSAECIRPEPLSAEWGWLDRCGGPARGPRLNPADYPTVQSVVGAWSQVERYVREFLSKLKDGDLARMAEYTNDAGEKRSMPIGELMHHAANHAVHHRGQVAVMLRLLGYVPGNFDLLFITLTSAASPRGNPSTCR